MRKVVAALLLVFAFAAVVNAVGQQVNLESGIVGNAKVFPIAAGESAGELAQYSIASAFKDLSLDRFLQYCGTTRLKPRLTTALSILTPDQLCAGADEFANVCSTTNCDTFRDTSACGLSEAQLEQQCVDRLTNESQNLFSDAVSLETNIASRCNDFKENYQGGDVRIGPTDTTVARQACISHGFQYSASNGIGECSPRANGSGNIEIGAGGENSGGGGIGGGGLGAGGAAPGGEGAMPSEPAPGSEPPSPPGPSPSGAIINYTCSDLDGNNTGIASHVKVSSSTGALSNYYDHCADAVNVVEYTCANATAGIATAQALPCASGYYCASPGYCAKTGTLSYTCTDNNSVPDKTLPGNVTIAASTNRTVANSTVALNSCNSAGQLQEYSCSSPGASYAKLSILSCPTGYTCPNGAPNCIGSGGAPPSGPITYSCTDNNTTPDTSMPGNVTITASNGSATTYINYCGSSTQVWDYSCQSPTSSTPNVSKAFCTGINSCFSGVCGPPATITYSCFDNNTAPDPTKAGNVTITASNGSATTYINYCTSDGSLLDYRCPTAWSSTPTSAKAFCPSGAFCPVGGRSCSGGSPAKAAGANPGTGLQIDIVPSGQTADNPITLLSQQEVQNTCVNQLRARVFESYATESIQSTCRNEVESTAELRSVFCRRPANAYNECRTYLENRCQFSQTATQECRAITNSQDALLGLLTQSMAARCEVQETTQTVQFNDLSSTLPLSSAFIVNGQEDKLIQAIATAQNATKPRDPIYEFILKPFCMKYVEEKQGAQQCNSGIERINEVEQFLNESRPRLSQQAKQQADTLIQNVETTSNAFREKCQAKDKNAGGICTAIFNR